MDKKKHFKEGLKDALPIALGYIPISITFALLAKSYQIPNMIIVLMSLLVFAGSSQFIGIKLISLGVTFPEIILTTFIVNFRNSLMSSAMAQKIDSNESPFKRAMIAYTVTDETFAIASSKMKYHIPTAYIAGLQGLLFFAFNLGTVLGTFIINDISPRITQSMGITIYAMFISILIPSVKKSNKVLRIVIISASISSFLTFQPWISISMGWIIIIATVITAMTMAYFDTEKEMDNE